MQIKRVLLLATIVSLIFLSIRPIFSQEAQETQESIEVGGAIPKPQSEPPDVQWVWGEAVSIDSQNKALLVKYFDYETDLEKEISIEPDSQTTYETIKSIDEIKPKDILSIDYIVNAEGRNIAKNINVEKPDIAQEAQEENIEENKPAAPVIEGTTAQ